MSDLTTVTMQQCSQLDGGRVVEVRGAIHGRGVKMRRSTYTVTTGDENSPWVCTCKAYEYAKAEVGGVRSCKHIRTEQFRQCKWHEQSGGPPEEAGVCPDCHGPTTYVKVAV